MEQVLFTIPIRTDWFPDGIPIYGFGVMLFLCFMICTQLAAKRAEKQGIPGDKVHDLALVLFIGGLMGARIVYMIQYKVPIGDFFRFWEGGIVFYGSAIGGAIAYRIFYSLVLKKFHISTWKLSDAVAPSLALGLALGRVGCFLNGCCYGHLACEDCVAVHFPLLTSPVTDEVVYREGLQTRTGFIPKNNDRMSDPRTVVALVEPGSQAQEAGLQPGDRILTINGKPNNPILLITDDVSANQSRLARFQQANIPAQLVGPQISGRQALQVTFPELSIYQKTLEELRAQGIIAQASDRFTQMLANWPRGEKSVTFTVERAAAEMPLPKFTPRTLGVHPTQVYETISMTLLFLLLLAYFPLRRHDGQIFTLLMMVYAVHRFINEQLRNDTAPVAFGLTLSQNISILILLGGIGLETYLWFTQPNRWRASLPTPPATGSAPSPAPTA
ncbi:prolipoprotein diacylglyceryl transferase family protein [Tuwongella immobilis]|uniref:Phosphatidylglycerol--prolipoprotein diacylglyceryl transferase n=1 Tax=Tuwongella immobilis TaxID=692036 RepID=A0A6C2YJW9_9BACT|nr:prolipoprotein diacylglyceryl transferase family protein [Tuwongella immobilis]VIP01242.1 prolipoprotein diacylglyceryl transferase : Prolipoprotein diacylglyceryl transferase OS=Pirellula staleyi (strain ATCC 27377 / DSM 6068 / ICPB 4128) GN=Psta_2025 PE=4 SV=1: LGT: PDZ [Tuwongella immobilis]VTR97910.1 prolipoprotein diacylglyceryl transferase : Prolipoprotein diacylglyceryl transferase OS=Pirellula staleyi (strain ATCC 27377 / DSM 6068 / ICPB 4128) GN=Psta_2025 PE=4 SV=1: LGT: PDZ [Tuwongel